MNSLHGAKSVALVALRGTLGFVILWAGLSKVQEPALFALTARAYQVLPVWAINPFAIVVPWMEATTGLLLIFGMWTRGAAISCCVLLVSFSIALALNILRGAEMSCDCFGLDGTQATLGQALLTDLLMMGCAVILVLAARVPLSVDSLGKMSGRRPINSEQPN